MNRGEIVISDGRAWLDPLADASGFLVDACGVFICLPGEGVAGTSMA